MKWAGSRDKIFSPSGRGRGFFLTSLFIELIEGWAAWVNDEQRLVLRTGLTVTVAQPTIGHQTPRTMSTALILGLVGGLLMLAFLANRVFRVTRVPDVLALMALGLVLGPVLGLVNPAHLSSITNVLGTLAIILVLFEGGLELDLRRTLRHFPGSLLLAVLAYGFSITLVGLIIHKGLGMPLTTALAVGAVLGCTSSTVVLPVLQQLGRVSR